MYIAQNFSPSSTKILSPYERRMAMAIHTCRVCTEMRTHTCVHIWCARNTIIYEVLCIFVDLVKHGVLTRIS